MKVRIYASMLDEIQKRLNFVKRKSEKYNCKFDYAISDEYVYQYYVKSVDHINHCVVRDVIPSYATVVDVEISDDCIKQSGWSVIAKIEHNYINNAWNNIVYWFDESRTNSAWNHAEPKCEHCHINRVRNVTFLVTDGQTIKQIGSSCLHDYTGIYPFVAVSFAELSEYSIENNSERFDEYRKQSSVLDVESMIAKACECITKYGYVKSNTVGSTKSRMIDFCDKDISEKSKQKANEIVEFFKSFNTSDNFLSNLQSTIKCGFCKQQHLGFLAYAPIAYDKLIAEAEAKANKERENKKINFYGNIGDKITIQAKIKLLTSYETCYNGYNTTIVRVIQFITNDNVCFIWKTSSYFDYDENQTYTVKATIKNHSEYNNTKQTILTRCKII